MLHWSMPRRAIASESVCRCRNAKSGSVIATAITPERIRRGPRAVISVLKQMSISLRRRRKKSRRFQCETSSSPFQKPRRREIIAAI